MADEKFDVLDTKNIWCTGTVRDRTPDSLFIHYDGWASRWDEWIPNNSERLAPLYSRQSVISPNDPSWNLRRTHRLFTALMQLDVQYAFKWYVGRVVAIEHSRVRVYSETAERTEWFDKDSHKLQILHTHTNKDSITHLDMKHESRGWLVGTITKTTAHRLYIVSDVSEGWIAKDAEEIAPLHTHTKKNGSEVVNVFNIGMTLDVLDSNKVWRRTKLINTTDMAILVSGYEWISALNISERVAKCGSRTGSEKKKKKKLEAAASEEESKQESEQKKRWKEDIEERLQCVVCLERERDTVLLPCSHLSLCNKCATKLTHCGICTVKIDSLLKIKL